jgi:dihydroorotase
MNNNYRVNPPIRNKEDVDFLIKAIQDGWVDAISTDHAPHSDEDKQNGAPGISGIETAFAVCYTKLVKEGHITLNKLSEIMSKNTANIMEVKKGQIEVGYDGDLVIVNIDSEFEVSPEAFVSKGKNTPFGGMKVYGEVITTIKGGKIVFNRN